MAEYTIQKAVNHSAVVKKRQRTLEYMAAYYEAQHKYDGCCGVITLRPDGSTLCQSRTGEVYPSLDLVAAELAVALDPQVRFYGGLVLIGEAWWPGAGQFSAISGEFRRLVPSPKLQFIVNDVLTLQEFTEGHSPLGYLTRMGRVGRWHAGVQFAESSAPGTYGDPQTLCNWLVQRGGYDGLILRDPEGTWTRGSGTTGEIVKIKRVLSYDLRPIDMVEGEGKHKGRMGAVAVSFEGKKLWVGTGFTDAQRKYYWETPNGLAGKIFEIEAMDLSSEGLLREPRFKGERHDKLEPDTL